MHSDWRARASAGTHNCGRRRCAAFWRDGRTASQLPSPLTSLHSKPPPNSTESPRACKPCLCCFRSVLEGHSCMIPVLPVLAADTLMEALLRVRVPAAAPCSLALPLRRSIGLACRAARPDSPASTSSASSAGQGQQKAAAEPPRPLQAGLKVLMLPFLAAHFHWPASEVHLSSSGVPFSRCLTCEARHAGMLKHAGALASMHAVQNKRNVAGSNRALLLAAGAGGAVGRGGVGGCRSGGQGGGRCHRRPSVRAAHCLLSFSTTVHSITLLVRLHSCTVCCECAVL